MNDEFKTLDLRKKGKHALKHFYRKHKYLFAVVEEDIMDDGLATAESCAIL